MEENVDIPNSSFVSCLCISYIMLPACKIVSLDDFHMLLQSSDDLHLKAKHICKFTTSICRQHVYIL